MIERKFDSLLSSLATLNLKYLLSFYRSGEVLNFIANEKILIFSKTSTSRSNLEGSHFNELWFTFVRVMERIRPSMHSYGSNHIFSISHFHTYVSSDVFDQSMQNCTGCVPWPVIQMVHFCAFHIVKQRPGYLISNESTIDQNRSISGHRNTERQFRQICKMYKQN